MWSSLANGVDIFHGDFRQSGITAATHIITDPPYEDELHAAAEKRSLNRVRNDGRSNYEPLGFNSVNGLRKSYSTDLVGISGGWLLLFCLAEGVRAWRDDLQAAGAKWDTTLAWIKPDASPRFNGQGASRGFECIISCWCGKGYRSWNGGGKRGLYTHVVNGSSRTGEHPTEKPLSLMCELIGDFTRPGDTIYDPFMGSGTTGLACIRLGRKFVGCEQDEDYFNLAKRRLVAALSQPDFFVAVPEKMKQEKLL